MPAFSIGIVCRKEKNIQQDISWLDVFRIGVRSVFPFFIQGNCCVYTAGLDYKADYRTDGDADGRYTCADNDNENVRNHKGGSDFYAGKLLNDKRYNIRAAGAGIIHKQNGAGNCNQQGSDDGSQNRTGDQRCIHGCSTVEKSDENSCQSGTKHRAQSHTFSQDYQCQNHECDVDEHQELAGRKSGKEVAENNGQAAGTSQKQIIGKDKKLCCGCVQCAAYGNWKE